MMVKLGQRIVLDKQYIYKAFFVLGIIRRHLSPLDYFLVMLYSWRIHN